MAMGMEGAKLAIGAPVPTAGLPIRWATELVAVAAEVGVMVCQLQALPRTPFAGSQSGAASAGSILSLRWTLLLGSILDNLL